LISLVFQQPAIEQQLVRTLTMRYEISFLRKIREILLACMVYRVMPKSDIPGVYLSIAYFGWKMNGLLEACNLLGYDVNKITLEQSASLISRLKYPEPQKPSPHRLAQIYMRKKYIIKLLSK